MPLPLLIYGIKFRFANSLYLQLYFTQIMLLFRLETCSTYVHVAAHIKLLKLQCA